MKLFTDAEIVKEYFVSVSSLLFDKFSNKNQIYRKLK
jgi:hypothetical protein